MTVFDDLTTQIAPTASRTAAGPGKQVTTTSRITNRTGTKTALGYTDLLNAEKLPNVGNQDVGYYNINEPNWTEQQWKDDPLTLALPTEAEMTAAGDPCLNDCALKEAARERKCDYLRRRVEVALDKVGCPSTVMKRSNAADSCTNTLPATTNTTATTTSTTTNKSVNCPACPSVSVTPSSGATAMSIG